MEGHQANFWNTYVFSIDHKMIAKQYLLTGLIMALVGGYMAYVFRMQLAYPGEVVPLFGQVTDEAYNSLITLHGTVMVFWVGMPILLGAFGNFLIPLMIGADDMAFPTLNMLSYWTFFLSTVVLAISLFVPDGPAASGWTAYPPLSARAEYSGVGWGMNLWILAVALEFFSVLMGGVNYLTTTFNMRTKGLKFFRLPMMIWMQVTATLLFMFSVGPLIAGALMLLLDRTAGTSFFVPDAGGDPLLFQHLFWFFGHPEVYVLLLPAIGIVVEIITTCARKALFGYKMIIYSTMIAGVLSFMVWAHHQFISGMDPRMAMPFALLTIIISVPFAVILFALIGTLWRGSITFTSGFLFAIAMLAEFLIGGVTGIINGAAASDIFVHDTMYVVSHFHFTLVPITIFSMIAGIYHWFPKMFGRMMCEKLGKLHFILTVIPFNIIFIPLLQMGMAGHQRRIPDPSEFDYLKPWMGLHEVATIALIVMLCAQAIFIFNFFYSMYKGKEASSNPWEANTLEWSAPSPPVAHGNFETVPKVYRGPYEYGRPEDKEDYAPQWLEKV